MATYTVQIEAGDVDGAVWQAVAPSETIETEETAAELAAWVATNQTVADGWRWRVLVWTGDEPDGDPAAIHEDGPLTVVERRGAARVAARTVYDDAGAALKEAVQDALAHDCAEAVVARVGQVDRMAVRKWAGKR